MYLNAHVWNLENGRMSLFAGAGIEMQSENGLAGMGWGKGRWGEQRGPTIHHHA